MTHQKETRVVNVKKNGLPLIGYNSINEWMADPNNLYIGRDMSFYPALKNVKGSKWRNPYRHKRTSRQKCLKQYKSFVMNSKLYHQLDELEGKVLGCWCSPEPCHGNVLIELIKEKKEAAITADKLDEKITAVAVTKLKEEIIASDKLEEAIKTNVADQKAYPWFWRTSMTQSEEETAIAASELEKDN